MFHDVASILQETEHNMAKILNAYKPALEAIVLPFQSDQVFGRYDSLNSNVDREHKQNRKAAALREIDEVGWKIDIALHDVRCISEAALVTAIENAAGIPSRFFCKSV